MKTQKFIKESRKKLNLTQKELSEKLNAKGCKSKRCNIAKYETGRAVPPGDLVLTVLELLNIKYI